MGRSPNFICLFIIFNVCVTSITIALNYSTSYNENHNSANEEVSEEYDEDDLEDILPRFRSFQSCETPNHEPADCIPITRCDILLKQITNKKASAFLLASQCGLNNDVSNPKVCCGKYDNFKNITRKSVKRVKVLPKFCGRQRVFTNNRILGGSEASLGEYPWMARLIYENNFGVQSDGCSGFLVHSKFVITAAHCTHPYHNKIKGQVKLVILGGHNTTAEKDCTFNGKFCPKSIKVAKVVKVINHPEYNPATGKHSNDIAIIRITQARRSDFVQPICIPRNDAQIPSRYYLSGWGITENGSKSEVKLKVEVDHFDHAECKMKYSEKRIDIVDTQICAGGERKKDSCSGDSGGPLMMVNDDETWFASGIVSFGVGCGVKGWPGVYTNITKFLPWIRSQMRDNMKSIKKKRKGIVKKAKNIKK